MNLLDWLLLLLVGAYALSGYWQGFVTGAFSTVGLLLGGYIGIWLAPLALGDADPSLLVSLGALLIVILCATVGQAGFQVFGARVREKIKWQPMRVLDAVGGAALSACAVLLVAWALGVAISGTRIGAVTPLVRDSAVLERVDGVLPDAASAGLREFNTVVGTSIFPRYLEPFARENIVEVSPGPRRLLNDPEVVGVKGSVLKIRGTNRCGRGIEGTGFVYDNDRLMTNAHVVAGVDEPEVEIDGESVSAEVVHYDPDLDIAVLALETGTLAPLPFDEQGQVDTDPEQAGPETGVAIVGYPQDGPYDVQVGRIRAEQRLRSPDIYGEGTVLRDVFSVRGLVRPGNSGGPMVDSEGEVVAVVFAASVQDAETGYALTADAVQDAARSGSASGRAVSTGECAS